MEREMQKYDTAYVERFLRSRRHLEEVVERANSSQHYRSWQTLAEVNGLKNTEVVSIVLSSGNMHGSMLWERIIPSARTWMRYLVHNYVVIEDSVLVRFALRQCSLRETAHFTVFHCIHEANYILTRNCSSEYYVANGPCCKIDELLNFLINDSPQLFATTKYLIQADDDTYWRVDQVMRFLAVLEHAGLSHLPIIGNPQKGLSNNFGVWHIEGCKEIMASGWMQPIILNRAALERMRIPSAAYGLRDTCRSFDLSQDVGIEVYSWLLELYHVQLPSVEINGNHKGISVLRPDLLAVHSIKHSQEDRCSDSNQQGNGWPASLRYNQKVSIGCGDVDVQAPYHDPKRMADMYDVYKYFRDHGETIPFGIEGQYGFVKAHVIYDANHNTTTAGLPTKKIIHILNDTEVLEMTRNNHFRGHIVSETIIPRIDHISGYKETRHAKQYNITGDEWHPFTLHDCNPPGRVH